MEVLIGLLLGLVVLSTFFYLVGKFLFFLGRSVARNLFSNGLFPASQCPSCRQKHPSTERLCPKCGYNYRESPKSNFRRELAIASRLLRRLVSQGKLTETQIESIERVLREESGLPTVPRLRESSEASPLPIAPGTPATSVVGDTERLMEELLANSEAAAVAQPAEATKSSKTSQRIQLPPLPEPPRPIPPPKRKPALIELFKAFMEERNLRWGEFLSGLLIVGSAIGLTVSLWTTLAERILFLPALLLMGVTFCLQGTGLFAYHRWGLKSTGRGLLVVGLLLNPLCFLSLIAMSKQSLNDPGYYLSVAVGLVLFSVSGLYSSRAVVPAWPVAMTVAVMGSAGAQIVLRHFLDNALSPGGQFLLASVPLLLYVGTSVHVFRKVAGSREEFALAPAALLFLGVATFAQLVASVLVLAKLGFAKPTLEMLSAQVSFMAVPTILFGGWLHRRAIDKAHVALRVQGSALTLMGMFACLASLILAWPNPQLVVLVSILNAVLLLAAANAAEMEIIHLGVIASLAFGVLVGFHTLQASIEGTPITIGTALARRLIMGRSALVLLVLSVFSAFGAELLRRLNRLSIAPMYAIGAAGLAVVALIFSATTGFRGGVDSEFASVTFSVLAVACTVSNVQLKRRDLSWLSTGLVFLASYHLLGYNDWSRGWLDYFDLLPRIPLAMALLIHATIGSATAAAYWCWRWQNDDTLESEVVEPHRLAGLATAFTSITLLVFNSPGLGEMAVAFGLLAVVWLLQANLTLRLVYLSLFQFCSAAAGVLIVTYYCHYPLRQADFSFASNAPLLQWQAIALAVWCFAWAVLRGLFAWTPLLLKANKGTWWHVDHTIACALVLGQFVFGWLRLVPGLSQSVPMIDGWGLTDAFALFQWCEFLTVGVSLLLPIVRQRSGLLCGLAVATAGVLALSVLTHQPAAQDLLVAAQTATPGFAGWLAWILTVTFLTARLCIVPSASSLWGLVMSISTLPLLLLATALSPAEITAGTVTLAVSLGVLGCISVLSARDHLYPNILRDAPWTRPGPWVGGHIVALGLAALPVTYVAWRHLFVIDVNGQTFFGVAVVVVPFVLLGVAAAVAALREANYRLALGGCLGFCAAVTFGVLERLSLGTNDFPMSQLALLLMANALCCSLYGHLWQLVCIAHRRFTEEFPYRIEMDRTVANVAGTLFGLACMGVLPVLWNRQTGMVLDWEWIGHVGSPLGWLTALSMAVVGVTRRGPDERMVRQEVPAALTVLVPVLLASTFASDAADGFKWLIVSWPVAALGLLAFGSVTATNEPFLRHSERWLRNGWNLASPVRNAVALVAVLGIAQSLFGSADPELKPWCAAGAALAAACLAAIAVLERHELLACAAGLTLNWSATLVALHYSANLPPHQWYVLLVQVNVTALAVSATLWRAVTARFAAIPEKPLHPSRAYAFLALLAVAVHTGLLMLGSALLIAEPGNNPVVVSSIGSAWGWLAFVAITVCLWTYRRHFFTLTTETVHAICLSSGSLVLLLAASGSSRSDAMTWTALHMLILLSALFSATTALWCDLRTRFWQVLSSREDTGRVLIGWSMLGALLATLISVRSGWVDPQGPWWTAAAQVIVTGAFVMLAVVARRIAFAYGSLLSAMLVTLLVIYDPLDPVWTQSPLLGLLENTYAVCFTAAAVTTFWLVMSIYWQHNGELAFLNSRDDRSLPREAGIILLCAIGATLALGIPALMTQQFFGAPRLVVGTVNGKLAVLAVAILHVAMFWDRRSRTGLIGLYWSVLFWLIMEADGIRYWMGKPFLVLPIVISSHLLATGVLWQLRFVIHRFGRVFSMPDRTADIAASERWFPVANAFLAMPLFPVLLLQCLTLTAFLDRSAAVYGLCHLAVGMILSAHGTQRSFLRWFAVAMVTVLALGVGWAIQSPAIPAFAVLHRAIRLMGALSVMAFVYAVVAPRILTATNSWHQTLRRSAATTIIAAILSLLGVLALEASFHVRTGGTTGLPITGWQIALVAVVLCGLSAANLSLAVLPGEDPLRLSARFKSLYVYAAELILALLFAHLYLAMPELFAGYLKPYWPVIAILIAFVGVGLGEFFERWKLPVLSRPLLRSGIFLPLLPVLGHWVVAAEKTQYSAVLFLVGLLYLGLALTHHSFVFGVAAAVAGNGGLLALLAESGVEILQHPQLWFVPPSLSILGAAQVNKDRLTEKQLASIRYFAVMLIYVSSTSDMFMTGIAESIWLPMALATLSVLGVLLGIVLQVRSYLYLGSAFLMLALSCMVWHASRTVGHFWPVWAFLFFLGLAVSILFGFFEKKRDDMLRLVEQVKAWER